MNSQYGRVKEILIVLFVLVNITYYTMAPRVMNFFGFIEPGGIVAYPFTFFISALLAELFGSELTKRLNKLIILCFLLFTAFGWISMKFSAITDDSAYREVFANYPKLCLSICIASYISLNLNTDILTFLKRKWSGNLFWLRSFISTSLGHISFSFMWIIIFHFNHLNPHTLFTMIINMSILKILLEAFAIIPLNFIRKYLSLKIKSEQLNHKNYNIYKLSPFISSEDPQKNHSA